MTRLIVLLTASAMFLANCSGSTTPASPSPASPMPSPAGIWVGSFSDPVAGEGGARLTLTEEPAGSGGFALERRLVGAWAVTFRNGETVEGRAEGAPAVSASSDKSRSQDQRRSNHRLQPTAPGAMASCGAFGRRG
jgi:hypothetical protein